MEQFIGSEKERFSWWQSEEKSFLLPRIKDEFIELQFSGKTFHPFSQSPQSFIPQVCFNFQVQRRKFQASVLLLPATKNILINILRQFSTWTFAKASITINASGNKIIFLQFLKAFEWMFLKRFRGFSSLWKVLLIQPSTQRPFSISY